MMIINIISLGVVYSYCYFIKRQEQGGGGTLSVRWSIREVKYTHKLLKL